MKYKLIVIKYEKNENYEEEMAKWKDNQGYFCRSQFDRVDGRPSLENSVRSLEVFLTDEEYNAVKEAVLKTFI